MLRSAGLARARGPPAPCGAAGGLLRSLAIFAAGFLSCWATVGYQASADPAALLLGRGGAVPARGSLPPPEQPSCVPVPQYDRGAWLEVKVTQSRTFSMIRSPQRVRQAMDAVVAAIEGGIPGDVVEAGCNRGGISILMASAAWAFCSPKKIYACDSFIGLPKTWTAQDIKADSEKKMANQHWGEISKNVTEGVAIVARNFRVILGEGMGNYELVPGWFNESLPRLPVSQISVLRLDGDLWSSTIDTLMSLYHKVSVGGYVIFDDYGFWPHCKLAVHDFFDCHEGFNITSYIRNIDGTAIYFKKPSAEATGKTPSRRTEPCARELLPGGQA